MSSAVARLFLFREAALTRADRCEPGMWQRWGRHSWPAPSATRHSRTPVPCNSNGDASATRLFSLPMDSVSQETRVEVTGRSVSLDVRWQPVLSLALEAFIRDWFWTRNTHLQERVQVCYSFSVTWFLVQGVFLFGLWPSLQTSWKKFWATLHASTHKVTGEACSRVFGRFMEPPETQPRVGLPDKIELSQHFPGCTYCTYDLWLFSNSSLTERLEFWVAESGHPDPDTETPSKKHCLSGIIPLWFCVDSRAVETRAVHWVAPPAPSMVPNCTI